MYRVVSQMIYLSIKLASREEEQDTEVGGGRQSDLSRSALDPQLESTRRGGIATRAWAIARARAARAWYACA